MASRKTPQRTDEDIEISRELVHLARLAVAGRDQDVGVFVQRLARKMRRERPEVADELIAVLREAPTRSSPLRRESAMPMPVDKETRLSLARTEFPVVLEREPVLTDVQWEDLNQLVAERREEERLAQAGLSPARSALLVGPPGVGKTLSARWLARSLDLPLLVLDLAAVMSSLLGRTGVNLRHVLDYAKAHPSVLLLDEFDAIAKRRGDDLDIGELKRLVTVLLQEIDDWPANSGLLLAATNHPELLDPAVWRRFDVIVEFDTPPLDARRAAIVQYVGIDLAPELAEAVALATDGLSFSDIDRFVGRVRRTAALADAPLDEALVDAVATSVARLPHAIRKQIATHLVASGLTSQRRAYEVTGVSRDTIRSHVASRTGEASGT